MFALLVEMEAEANSLERLGTLLESMVKLAEQEEGVVYYSVNRPHECHNAFILYELYKDRKAWETHLELPHIQEALRQFEFLLAAPPKIAMCDADFTIRFI